MTSEPSDDLSKLLKIPPELMVKVLGQLNLADIRKLSELHDFGYSLLESTYLTKPLPAEEGFKNRTNYERYQRRYQRFYPRSHDRFLASKYSQPELLMDFVRQRFLLLTTAITTLLVRGQDHYLRSLQSEDLLPYIPTSKWEPFSVLVLLGILHLTWGTYNQIESFFALYHPEDFKRDYLKSWPYTDEEESFDSFDAWLENSFPYYEELPLFPYACTYEEYQRILNNPRIPDFFKDQINLDHSTVELRKTIAPNLLYLGRCQKLFYHMASYDHHRLDLWGGYSELLSVFLVNPPLLGFVNLELTMIYPQCLSVDPEPRRIQVRPFENRKLLMSLLRQSEAQLRSPVTDYYDVMENFVSIMNRAINDNQEELFTDLWDLMVDLSPQNFAHENKHDYLTAYAKLVDHCLSVDNSYFIDQCRRRIPEIKAIILHLGDLILSFETIMGPMTDEEIGHSLRSNSYSTRYLSRYLLSYHRSIAFRRVNEILGINILDHSRSKTIDLFHGLHFATLRSLLKENLLDISPTYWEDLVAHYQLMGSGLIYSISDITINTDQPILGISDVLKFLKDKFGDRINLTELFFNDDLSSTHVLKTQMESGPDIFNTLFYLYPDDLLSHPYFESLKRLQDSKELSRLETLKRAEEEVIKFYLKIITGTRSNRMNKYGPYLNLLKFLLDHLKSLDPKEHQKYLQGIFREVTGRSYQAGESLTDEDYNYDYDYDYPRVALLDYLTEQMDSLV